MREPELLPESDVAEILKFQEYMRDLDGPMNHAEFAEKYHEYLGMTKADAMQYSWWKRNEVVR